MTEKSTATATSRSGVSVLGLTFLILLVFKLAGMAGVSWGLANLSWFWIVLPLVLSWVWTLFFMVVLVIAAALAD